MRMITGKGQFPCDGDEIFWWAAPGSRVINVRFRYAFEKWDQYGGVSFVKEWGNAVWQIRRELDTSPLDAVKSVYGEFASA